MSSIITKTGTKDHAGTDCDVVMKICDKDGNCCETGNGLDNRGNDREKGDTDTYKDAANLASCAKKVICYVRSIFQNNNMRTFPTNTCLVVSI